MDKDTFEEYLKDKFTSEQIEEIKKEVIENYYPMFFPHIAMTIVRDMLHHIQIYDMDRGCLMEKISFENDSYQHEGETACLIYTLKLRRYDD